MKKGSSSNSFPKTFSIKFSPDRALTVILPFFTSCEERPVGAEFSYKVFGKGVWGKNLSSERFSPIITHNLLYKHHGKRKLFIQESVLDLEGVVCSDTVSCFIYVAVKSSMLCE